MKRRSLALGIGGVSALWQATAQRPPRCIGWLMSHTRERTQAAIEHVVERLGALGHVVGRDVSIDVRFADFELRRLPALAQELLALHPVLLVTLGNDAARVLMEATRSIPIVVHLAASPVESGLVASLARPGGNVTGVTDNQLEIAGKAVELLKSAAPGIVRVTVVWNPDAPGNLPYQPYADRVAQALGVKLLYFEVRRPQDLDLDALERTLAHALYVVPDPVVYQTLDALIRFARQRRLPGVCFAQYFARAGGLMSLTPDFAERERALAELIDKVLRGANPAELPMRQPSRYRLVVNQQAADRIGLRLPEQLLIRADELIR